jgi:hypothetical protein
VAADDREVAQALGQAAGGGVGADQLQLDARMLGGPSTLELPRETAERRPRMADPQAGVAGRRLGHQFVELRQDVAGAREHTDAGCGRRDRAAGAVQQADPEFAFQGQQVAGHRGLGDPELDRGVGERAGVDDLHQAPQLPDIHDSSV